MSFGLLTCHFGVAVQLAAIGAGDFVQDDACRSVDQVRVGCDITGLLGVYVGLAVVEYQSDWVNIKLSVLVVRDSCCPGLAICTKGSPVAVASTMGRLSRGRLVGDDLGSYDERLSNIRNEGEPGNCADVSEDCRTRALLFRLVQSIVWVCT